MFTELVFALALLCVVAIVAIVFGKNVTAKVPGAGDIEVKEENL